MHRICGGWGGSLLGCALWGRHLGMAAPPSRQPALPRRPQRATRPCCGRKLHELEVENLAQDGLTGEQLLAGLQTEPTGTAVKEAEVFLLGIGGADLNEGDDHLQAGACRAEACYAPVLKESAKNLEAIVAGIDELRGGQKTAVRAITQPNVFAGAEDVIPPFLKPVAAKIGIYQARTGNRAICQTMTKHGGRCIDVLHAFDGPSGMEDAYRKGLLDHEDCCYPTAKGQRSWRTCSFRPAWPR